MRWMLLIGGMVMLSGALLVLAQSGVEPPAPPLQPVPNYPDFVFETQSGSRSLSSITSSVSLVYFGYTSCPDICPTTLARFASAIRRLPEDIDATSIFISVDPERDDPEKASQYAQYFHPDFIGGTITNEETLREVTTDWGVLFRKVQSDSALGYTIDHGTQTFIYHRKSGQVSVVSHNVSSQALAQEIKEALNVQ